MDRLIHAYDYIRPEPYTGQNVLVIVDNAGRYTGITPMDRPITAALSSAGQ